MVDQYGVFGGMKIGRGNRVVGENLPHFIIHKFHMA
jgi:hypothetical protein